MMRKLDGYFFRIGKENICFTDLTEEQMDMVMDNRSEEWLKSLCKGLARVIQRIGEDFDLVGDIGLVELPVALMFRENS